MSNANSKVDAGGSSSCKDQNFPDHNSTKSKKRGRKWAEKRRKQEKTERDDKPKRDLRPPNYFFAVKIDKPKIRGAMQAVQDHLVQQNELLKHVVVSNKVAHLTVGLLHLPDQENVKKAVSMMSAYKENLQDIVSSQNFSLHIEGLGHFNQQVLFAKVQPDTNEDLLRKLAEFLSQKFIEFKSSSNFKYTPHLTLMKLSKIQRNYHLKKKIRHIDKTFFEHIMDIHFGYQKVVALQLLRMAGKEKDGYYICDCEIPFDTVENTKEKSTEEKYAEYLSSHTLTSIACVEKRETFVKESKEHSINNIAKTTVVSAMNTALEEVLMNKK